MASLPTSRAKLLLLLLAGAAIRTHAQECKGAYTAQITYMGCWDDNGEFRTLQSPVIDLGANNDPQLCADRCGAAGYNISGVEFSTQCFCGHYIESTGVKVPETDCSEPCPGDSSQICGNGNRMNLWQILNPDPIVTNNPNVANCNRDPLCSTGVCDTSKSISDRAAGLVNQMTLAEKIQALNNAFPGVPRLGVPSYQWWSEALHGVAGSTGVSIQQPPMNFSGATQFPCPISLSASWNSDLINTIGEIIATEGRAFDNSGYAGLSFFLPNINPSRNPLWGRLQETPGEDPFAAAQYAIAIVTGAQGSDPDYLRIIATCKHLVGYDVEDNRFANDVNITAQNMADYFLKPFAACVQEAQAASVMCAYTAVNGHPSCAYPWLLEDVLRENLGFSEPYNFVVSDCDAVDSMTTGAHLEANLTIASADSVKAGMDLDCGSTVSSNMNTAVQEGLITEDVISTAVTRLMAALVRVGFFNQPAKYTGLSWADVNTPASQKVAYESAAQGMTLLKNDGLLPITKAPSSVVVVGPYANATFQMQGNYLGTPVIDIQTPYEAFKQAWPQANVQFLKGVDINSADTSGIAAAVSAAKSANLVIFLGGLDRTQEDESFDRTSLSWPGQQESLIQQLSQTGKPLVVVQFGGGQVDDSALLSNAGVNSILWAGYPGQAGGPAIADTITGANAPAGRLPVTQYPQSFSATFDPLNLDIRSGAGQTYMFYTDEPVLPFGFGLHYTNFTLAPAGAHFPSTDIADLPDSVTVSFDVTNAGSVTSDYAALLFLSCASGPDASRPIKKLVAFDRLQAIAPGKTARADLVVETRQFANADADGTQWIYPGFCFLTLDAVDGVAQAFTLTGSAKQISTLPAAR